jgi:DNA polymerase sigma
MLKPERDFVLSKLSELACRCFDKEQPKIEIFGSLITGLALESSDLDVAVTGLRIDDRMMMIDDLQIMAKGIQSEWKSIQEFKAIETASIPVIKMVS